MLALHDPPARLADLAELLRLPAVLSVPGDTLLGAAVSGGLGGARRTAGLAGASSFLYLAGMALNDYADRDVDAVERPHRPIPSGRVDPKLALRLAQGLTAAGLASATWAGGVAGVTVAAPLAAAVWGYDTILKGSPAGPVAMATCRTLDVLLGAHPGRIRAAIGPAAVVGAHTLKVTMISRNEVSGGSRRLAACSLAGTAAVTGLGALAARTARRRTGCSAGALRAGATAALLGGFALSLARTEMAAYDDPTPGRLQKVVGEGVLGLLPLQAGMLASTGPGWAVSSVTALWPLAKHLSRRRAVT